MVSVSADRSSSGSVDGDQRETKHLCGGTVSEHAGQPQRFFVQHAGAAGSAGAELQLSCSDRHLICVWTLCESAVGISRFVVEDMRTVIERRRRIQVGEHPRIRPQLRLPAGCRVCTRRRERSV